eukprot:3496600-Ditylum_brightwellii.AAC.1
MEKASTLEAEALAHLSRENDEAQHEVNPVVGELPELPEPICADSHEDLSDEEARHKEVTRHPAFAHLPALISH